MTDAAGGETLAAILDALTLVQDQLEEIGERGKRLEANQVDILARLDTIDAAQAGVTDLQPVLERVLAALAEGNETTRKGLERVAEVAGLAHAAAIGNRAPLPADVVDDPLMERYVLSQPADISSTRRALVDWRRVAQGLDVTTLALALERQYQPSPTDDGDGRTLRYQLAAITRAELTRRGAELPKPPAVTIATDRSPAARRTRSAELLRMWRTGEEVALFAEPELAGAMDILAAARREGQRMAEEDLTTGLADLRETIAARLEAGDRPALAVDTVNRLPDAEVDRQR